GGNKRYAPPCRALRCPGGGGKIAFEILSMLPLLSSPFSHFFLPSLLFLKSYILIVPIGLNTCVLVLRSTGMAMRVSMSQSRDDPYRHPWLNPTAPGYMTSMRLLASYGVEI